MVHAILRALRSQPRVRIATARVACTVTDLRCDVGELSGPGAAASELGHVTSTTAVERIELRSVYEPTKDASARSGDGCPGCAVPFRKWRRTGHAAALRCDAERRGRAGAEPAGGTGRSRTALRWDAASDVGDWQEATDAYAALSGCVPGHQGRVGTQQVHPQLHVETVAGPAHLGSRPECGMSRRVAAYSVSGGAGRLVPTVGSPRPGDATTRRPSPHRRAAATCCDRRWCRPICLRRWPGWCAAVSGLH